jgi:16S rRNA (adenine1518-N6/adenine1519-N6)-dimethyltransferase
LSSSAPRPRLGQHFLADRNLLRRIADALDAGPDDVVLEIGPGKGTLTDVVAPRVRRVVAIERDRRLAHEYGLRNAECGIHNVELVVGDALRLDWHALAGVASRSHSALPVPHWKVVGNIPYAITSPLIEKALAPPLPACIVFLVQREVADRLAAGPGSREYGALSVGVQAVSRVERLFAVRPGAFRPPPRVQSAVVRLTPLAAPLVGPDEQAVLRTFVAACFGGRRKQLRNAVARATGQPGAAVAAGMAALGLDPAVRPETLSPPDFVRLLRWSRSL